MKVILTTTASIPMKAGDPWPTPFGKKTLTQADIDTGLFNQVIASHQRVVEDPDTNLNDLQSSLENSTAALATELTQG